MKRTLLALALLGIAGALSYGLQAGGGISVFVPESLYAHGQGSISVETNFQYAFGFGKFLSFPIGVTYDKINGLMPGGPDYANATAPWFVADSVAPYLMAKIRVPLSIFYVEAYGGGAINWNLALTPIGQNIEAYFGNSTPFNGTTVTSGTGTGIMNTLGYGWIAGVGLGVTVKKIQVGIDATYRNISSPLAFSGGSYTSSSNATIVLSGVAIGLNGSFDF